jgi:hypothetical protein
MRKVPLPIDRPNRRTIESLLKDFRYVSLSTPERDAIYDEMRRLQDEFSESPPMKKLSKRLGAINAKLRAKEFKLKEMVRSARQKYLVKGLTTAVLKEFESLVRYSNSLS